METRSILTAGLAGLATVLLVVVMFTPWGTASRDNDDAFGFGMNFGLEATVYFWEGEVSFNGHGDDFSWYDEDLQDEDGLADGVGLIRAGAIVLLVGLVGAVGAAVLGALTLVQDRLRTAAMVTAGAAALVTAIGLVLFATGTNEFLDEFGGDMVFHVGFYLAILAVLAVAGAALVPLLPVGERSLSPADFD